MHRLLFQYHPVIGHTYIPGLRARIEHEGGGYRVRTNAQGFRAERDFTPAKRPGTRRILLFGDSFTAGDGVENAARFSDLLETLLPGVEVCNLAISGTGTHQQYLAFREFAATLEHDFVVAAVYVENAARNVEHYHQWATQAGQRVFIAKPYFTLAADGSLVPGHQPVPRRPLAARALPPEELLALYTPPPAEASVAPAYDRADRSQWLLLRAILRRWAAESPAPFVVVPIPLHQFVEGEASASACQARFRELSAQPGLTVLDPLPALLGYRPEQRRAFRFPVDPHLTAAGHRALAEALAAHLAPEPPAPGPGGWGARQARV